MTTKPPSDDADVNYLLEAAEKQGIACSTVKDGHVFVLTKLHLLAILSAMDEKKTDKAVLFVKKPGLLN